jgi:hypothetical protein
MTMVGQDGNNGRFKPGMENQRNLWNRAYSEAPSFFGPEPSCPSSRLWKLLEGQPSLKILELGGIHLFSVRNTHDAHYGKGRRREGQVFEIDGFPVRFFKEDIPFSLTS